jgi:hypothetical protein
MLPVGARGIQDEGIFQIKLIGIFKEEHIDISVNPTGMPEDRNERERELFVDGRFMFVN